jgi:hypothetical protein
MAVGDYDIAPFVSPVGTEIATIQTRGNDNVLRDKFVSHQADEVAHLQSGLASARPASGTVTGETYLATDTGALSVWSGSAWVVNNTGAGDVVGDDTSTTVQNIVAYSTTGGKNITELTGTQGDVLYHNGTNWAKLAAGTSGFYLKTNGAGANPAWASVSADPWTYKILASDYTTTSTTLATISAGSPAVALEFTPAANTTYEFEAILYLRTSVQTTNPRTALVWSTGLTDGVAVMNQTTNSASSPVILSGNSINGTMQMGGGSMPNNTQSWPCLVTGTAIAGASPSNSIRLQMASEVAGDTVTVKTGSFIKYRTL